MAVVQEFKQILSDRSERAKRNLLAVSTLVLGMFWFGKIPDHIPFINIHLETSNDYFKFFVALLAVTTYLLINFVSLAGSDFRVWLDEIWERQSKVPGTGVFGINVEQLEKALQRNESDRFFNLFVVGSISTGVVLPFSLGILSIGFCAVAAFY